MNRGGLQGGLRIEDDEAKEAYVYGGINYNMQDFKPTEKEAKCRKILIVCSLEEWDLHQSVDLDLKSKNNRPNLQTPILLVTLPTLTLINLQKQHPNQTL
jgi:hypothetical protein